MWIIHEQRTLHKMSCDYGACDTQPVPCSNHGICTNGTCHCDPGFNGNGYYFSYRDCHIADTTVFGFAYTTIFFACVAALLGLLVVCTRFCSNSNLTIKQKLNKTVTKVRRLLLLIYLRAVAAAVVSILLEVGVVTDNFPPLYAQEPTGFRPEIVYRSLFPWLILGGTFYIVEWIVVVLPLQFLNTSRDSAGLTTATKNTVIKWFATHYKVFDGLYFLQFGWLAVVRMLPNGSTLCGCWCQSVMELSVGWACVLPMFFMNAALSTLLGMVYKTKEDAAERHVVAMLVGWDQFQFLYGAKATQLTVNDAHKKGHITKFRILHGATLIAAYGAIVTCTLSAFFRPMRERPEIFVEVTMVLAHFFNICCIVGISGADLPCRKSGKKKGGSSGSKSGSGSSGSNKYGVSEPQKDDAGDGKKTNVQLAAIVAAEEGMVDVTTLNARSS